MRVLIVAEQPFARLGLRTLLAERDDLTIVDEAASLEEASPRLTDLALDAILAAPPVGPPVGPESPTESPAQSTPIILLVGETSPSDVARLLQGPVRGLLSEDATADEIVAAIGAVAQGMMVMEPRIGRLIASTVPPAENLDGSSAEEQLTEREREVLQLVALGLPNKTIATRLKISEHTVKFHVGSILAKLDAGSRTEAVTRAARRGLLIL
jgi:DNA-binding NarL/FixJ family response regulator